MNYLLSCRNQKTGGPVVPGFLTAGLGLGTLSDLQLESRVTVLLHGFNVNRPEGRKSLLKLAGLLTTAGTGSLLAVLWPGDHWSGPLSYSFEGRDADDTAFELCRYLHDNLRAGAEISFIAHSLGCRVAMETIKRLAVKGRDVDQVCLMAAAIDDDSISAPQVYKVAGSQAQRVASLSSKKDTILHYAYPAGDLLQAFLFWKDSNGQALGYHGPRKHRKSSTLVPANMLDERIPKNKKVSHGDYLPGEQTSSKEFAAAKFADEVIGGAFNPVYG